MSQSNFSSSLLPIGMEDLLPDEAFCEKHITEKMLKSFHSFGYQLTSPPLAEYTDSLFEGKSQKLNERSFRMMDPSSHKMLAIRPDITMQIARIASSRLSHAPRPLRLCYQGPVLWVSGNPLDLSRQFNQLGIELIGVRCAKADTEVLQIGLEALSLFDITDISIDITCPPLAGELIADIHLSPAERDILFEAFNEKNVAQIKEFKDKLGDKTEKLMALLTHIGIADKAFATLKSFDFTGEAARQIKEIEILIQNLSAQFPNIQITFDALENRGFNYYSGVAYNIYDKKNAISLARGGRYRLPQNDEPASGLSFYTHNLRKVASNPTNAKRIYLPFDAPEAVAKDFRAKGWITIRAFEFAQNPEQEAIAQNCDYRWENDILREIGYDETAENKAQNGLSEEIIQAEKKGRPIFKG